MISYHSQMYHKSRKMLKLTEMAQDTTTNDQIQGLPRAW
jgi:hypothetical protein